MTDATTEVGAGRARRLLFPELEHGLRPSALATASVREVTRSRRVPSAPSRALQRLLMRRGALSYEGHTVRRQMAARRDVLGDAAPGPPRLLIRVDEFPHAQAADDPRTFGTEAFRRFHDILAEAGVAYLLAVTPRVSTGWLNPGGSAWRPIADDEVAVLDELRHQGVPFAAHGLDHRTRRRSPRRRTELGGLGRQELAERLDAMTAELAEVAVRPAMLVPPFNRFDWQQWPTLAERFDVIGGGPENVMTFGFHDTPDARDDAVWLPSYAPFYGRAGEVTEGIRRLSEQGASVWVPVTLHWGWEAEDGLRDLQGFARAAAELSHGWEDFLRVAAN